MSQDVSIRTRTADDVSALSVILEKVHQNDRWPICRPANWAEWLQVANETHAWVAELDGEVVGHASLQSPPTSELMIPFWIEATGLTAEAMVEITRVFSTPRARGTGAGKALLQTAIDHARRLGLEPVLYTSEIDLAAQRLYERSGWQRIGEAPEVLPNGQSLVMIAYVSTSS